MQVRIHEPQLETLKKIIDSHVEIPTPLRVAAGLPVEVSVGVVTKSHLRRCDQGQQGRCFLVQC